MGEQIIKEAKYYVRYEFLSYGISENICMEALACYPLGVIGFGDFGTIIGAFSVN